MDTIKDNVEGTTTNVSVTTESNVVSVITKTSVVSVTSQTNVDANISETNDMKQLKVTASTMDTLEEYIRLRVITTNDTDEVHFRVRNHTSLGRLKRSYSSRFGLVADELRFVFDGYRIQDDDTPESIGMVNDDVIEIYQERSGGSYLQ